MMAGNGLDFQSFLDADLTELANHRRLSGYAELESPRPAHGGGEMAALCKRLSEERDRALEEAREAVAARDTALAACAQLASLAPRKPTRELDDLEAENKHLHELCARMQAAGRELVETRNQSTRERERAVAALDDAEEVALRFQTQRDEAVLELEEVRQAADAMLTDAGEHITYLTERGRKLEAMVERLLAERDAPSGRGSGGGSGGGGSSGGGSGGGGSSGGGSGGGGSGGARRVAREHETPREEAFGMTHTRAAIEKAVREAVALPAAERRKKLNALRLKWHPDKHEVLREMATEVTKLINEAVARYDDAPAPAPAAEP